MFQASSVPGAEQLQKLLSVVVIFSIKTSRNLTTTPKREKLRKKLRNCFFNICGDRLCVSQTGSAACICHGPLQGRGGKAPTCSLCDSAWNRCTVSMCSVGWCSRNVERRVHVYRERHGASPCIPWETTTHMPTH